MDSEAGPVIVIADTHLGLLAGQRFYGIRNDSQCDMLGLASFVDWLGELESTSVMVVRGDWGGPLEIRKPSHLILLGDYLELWDASDAALEVSSRGIWNTMEKLTCEKIYLVGNHDFASSQTIGRFPQGASSIEIVPDTYPAKEEGITRWLEIGGTAYVFLHGHQFDLAFRCLGKLWVILSYLRDGAEAFRLWSWVLVLAAFVTLFGSLLPGAFQGLGTFSGHLLTLAAALFLAGALPRVILTVARPLWNKSFATRYLPAKALKGFVEWWKSIARKSQIPTERLCVVYGHTHLIDIVNSSEVQQVAEEQLPEQLTLLNIPSWVADIREEYQKILRDVALYIDSSGFHLLGWDWRKHQPFYIPIDVARRIAAGTRIDERIVQSLMSIGWPEKLLAKITEPPKLLALNYPINRPNLSALNFIDSLRVDEERSEYFEVAEEYHSEHRVYNQSQYLLSAMFKLLGKENLSQAIRRKHDPSEPDNDPTRQSHKAGDRFCVLEGNTEPFYLAGHTDAENNDEIALLALYWLDKKHPVLEWWYRKKADRLWKKLLDRFIQEKGVLQMDTADRRKQLYPVYKVALFGILAKRMKQTQILATVKEKLKEWQHSGGGWETDRRLDLAADGVANIETTALVILALAD